MKIAIGSDHGGYDLKEQVKTWLQEMGHEVEILNTNLTMGRGQIIWRTDNGLLVGGTEPRCDGAVAAW